MPEMKSAKGQYFRGDELPTQQTTVALKIAPADAVK
jgi:hypothetical protein